MIDFDTFSSYHIDCGNSKELLKGIPSHSVDLLFTDPPYNIGKYSTGDISLPNRSIINNHIAGWDETEFSPREWIAEFLRVMKATGNLFVFTSYNQIGKWHECLDPIFDTTQFMVWHKTNPVPKIYKAGFLNSCELIICCWNKGHTWNFLSQKEMHNFLESSICMSPERTKNPKHPTQKPVSILEKIIKISTNENEIVLDPFMGVGSTGVAALRLQRRFIGFEINEEYYQAAYNRLKTETKNEIVQRSL